jgi:hypothetical protein
MSAQGIDVVCIDTTAGFLDSGGFYQLAMGTVGEVEPLGTWDMISKIIQKVGNKKIRTLQIHGHGCPGAQGIAFSSTITSNGSRALLTDGSGNLVGDGYYMKCVGPYFLPKGRIYLGGCNVAVGEEGADLLRAISKAVRRTGKPILTFASESWQNPWLPGYEGIDGGLVRYSDGDHVLYTNYSGMD